MTPLLPVYLVHWDAPIWCQSAVASILESTGIELEVTVIDNGQRTGPPLDEVLPRSARLVRMSHNTGYTGGANAALRDFLDSRRPASHCVIGSHDLHVEPDALATLLTAGQEFPEFGILGPWFTEGVNGRDGPYSRVRGKRGSRVTGGPILERTWVTGAAMLLSRRCVEAVGGFDVRLGSYVEDVDLCLRAWDAGFRVGCVPGARARSLGSGSGDADRTCAIDFNNILVAAKRGGWRQVGATAIVTSYYFGLTLGAGLAPWRPPSRRALSRQHARGHGQALGRMWRDAPLLRSVVVDPDSGHRLDPPT